MIRRLKVMGLAVVAVTALTAVAAASAQAVEFHATQGPAFLKGEQKTENVFTVNGGNVKCKKAVFTGEQANKTAASVTVHPAYSECTAFGQAAEVNTTGCNYVLQAAGTVSIECETGKEIVVTAKTAGCTVKVKAQEPGTPKVEYTNEGGKTEILVTSKVEKITYTSSGGICGASGENGKYTGTVLTKGYKNAGLTEQQAIWVE